MRLAPTAAHQFGGIALDRARPLRFTLDGRRIEGFVGDTVLSAVLAAGIDSYGTWQGQPIGLSEQSCPAVTSRRTGAMPMHRMPAVDGLDLQTIGTRRRTLPFRKADGLGHVLDELGDPPWLDATPETVLDTELLVIGGGVAGLAAADAAATDGHAVILAERRPWLGGDARYFGVVGDEESPEALSTRLAAAVAGRSGLTCLVNTEAFALNGREARLHRIELVDGVPRSRVIAVRAERIVLATGATQRLPVFPGNRQPGVMSAIGAYHFAKRYGAAVGPTGIVATQGNHAYRLALRLHDAGVAVRRVVDSRIGAQSRFIDFAKATGLTLSGGQIPLAASNRHFTFAPSSGTGDSVGFDATQLIVAGTWQPELSLWMLAGGGVGWSADRCALMQAGGPDGIAVAGSAAGYRSMRACVDSGIAAQAALFGHVANDIADTEIGTDLETPDAANPVAPAAADSPSFLDFGGSLAVRPGPSAARALPRSHLLTLGDVAASVELDLIAASDAGAVAEERGAPGSDLAASDWRPSEPTASADDRPVYLSGRFGEAPQRRHLMVDGKRTFEIGALVYRLGVTRDPEQAIGVIVAEAPVGGIALVAATAAEDDRFVIETLSGPSPARPAR